MSGSAATLEQWAGSGAMMLTGRADGAPSAAPAGVVSAAVAAADDLAELTARWGRPVAVDGPALLGERAALTGMSRNGSVSVGGSARFVACADGWVVLNLPRPEDVAALPALVGRAVAPDDWPLVAKALAAMPGRAVVEQAGLLGLAVALPGETEVPVSPVRELAAGGRRRATPTPLVVDLTSLWAGPLAGGLLHAAGARVVKVEGRRRPDGARRGTAAFFDLLNHGKECLALDFDDRTDRALLRSLIARADLVLEGSRARVFDGLGIDPAAVAASGTSWISVTGHGRTGDAAHRVGFGDDAAVAGGLLDAPAGAESGTAPGFVADAVADPLTGLVVAAHAAELLGGERAAFLEVPLARVAAWARPQPRSAAVHRVDGEWVVEAGGRGARFAVAPPRHRPLPPRAAGVDAHGPALREEFGGVRSNTPG
jgi:hypothetical protein